MKFVVQARRATRIRSPPRCARWRCSQEVDATEHRELRAREGAGNACSPFEWEIRSDRLNGTVLGANWDDITEYPELDDTEVWKLRQPLGHDPPDAHAPGDVPGARPAGLRRRCGGDDHRADRQPACRRRRTRRAGRTRCRWARTRSCASSRASRTTRASSPITATSSSTKTTR